MMTLSTSRWRHWATLLPVLAAIAVALRLRKSSMVDGSPVPMGFDSFYHATRVLHALANGEWLPFEFDPQLLAPEGTTVPWSWGWDSMLILVARIGGVLSPTTDPITVTSALPPLLAGVAVLMFARILSLLGIGWGAQQVGSWTLALHPMSQSLFGWGVLDHHGGEFLGWLAVLWAVISLWRNPSTMRWAVLGTAFGAALLTHTSMFVVQLPLLASLLLVHDAELRRLLSRRDACVFAFAILVSTLLVVMPSSGFSLGVLDFGRLGWFHVLIATISAGVVMTFSHRPGPALRVVCVLVAAATLLLPSWSSVIEGSRFVTGTMSSLSVMSESRSLWRFAGERGWYGTLRFYSPWLLILPVATVLAAIEARRDRVALFWPWLVALVFGCVLMLSQFRFLYFGLPFIVWGAASSADWMQRRGLGKGAWIAAALALAINLGQLTVRQPLAMDGHYERYANLIPLLTEICRREPRLLVADPSWGHFLRFHTECPIYSSQFVAERRQEARWVQGSQLFLRDEAQLAQELPKPFYLLVSISDLRPGSTQTVSHLLGPRDRLLGRPLMEASATSPDGAPIKAARLLAYP